MVDGGHLVDSFVQIPVTRDRSFVGRLSMDEIFWRVSRQDVGMMDDG